jgi:uncharacterized protein (DUF1015 family)
MPLVSPFAGLMYDPSKAGPLDPLVAPPFDAISPAQADRLRSLSPHNVVRLILGQEEEGDDEERNKYTRAAETLGAWRGAGVLRLEERAHWYPYEMRFTFQAEPRRVRGVICEVELEPFGGGIIPHERTMAGPIEDRLALLRRVRTNLSPIYSIFRGPCRPLAEAVDAACAHEPVASVVDDEGVEHRLWRLDGDVPVGEWLRDEQLLIADGHHRYTVALAFRDEMRTLHGPGPWDRMMMLLVDAGVEDPPVLPIHRLALDPPATMEGAAVRDLAEVLAAVSDENLSYGSASRVDGDVVHRVATLAGPPPTVWALHREVLGPLRLRFVPDAAVAEEAVRAGEAPAAFFLPPTRVERIRAVLERGERLPQKSTYFWPKPRTGLVLRPFA